MKSVDLKEVGLSLEVVARSAEAVGRSMQGQLRAVDESMRAFRRSVLRPPAKRPDRILLGAPGHETPALEVADWS